MQQSNLLTVFLPIALGIIMLGLGLTLTIDDFKRIVKYPKAAFIGLFCQMILLPTVCWGIAVAFGLAPALAVGMMLLAASPGGATANLYSHLSNGDVALNITLTAVNSLLSLFTLPLIVNLSLLYFIGAERSIPMQFGKIMEVFAIVLLPVSIGMLIRRFAPLVAAKADKPVKIASALLLVLVIAGATLKEKDNLVNFIQQVGLPVLVFNVLSMLVGYTVPLMFRVAPRQAIAIGMEIGIHNGTLAIYIALNVLQDSAMSIPPALYGLLMFFTAAIFGYWVKNR
ncbi:MAG: bile acid:sodium symporter family protein [Cytophagales bacterium]|nr:bile acid:sodium symporter family protein [Bernardetiaceae bacterium]MDW8203864.1 bile acid:sodium symporter family protein [Cytophagales bacterium]